MHEVRGQAVDDQTRCIHWGSERDVVAFRFPCCQGWWPCRRCHDETVTHRTEVWPEEARDVEAVRCGVCETSMAIQTYLDSGHSCPSCGAGFNPGCQDHWPAYFDIDGS